MLKANSLLPGKLALVTGGGSGIGQATCRIFAQEGATVVVLDVNGEAAQETLKSLTGSEDHTSLTTDVSDEQSVTEAFSSVLRKYSRSPDIVVNCAGISGFSFGVLNETTSSFDKIIGVNLKGTFLVTQAAIKGMLEGKVTSGAIVNIASIAATRGARHGPLYAASKGGVLAFTNSVAAEFAANGIRCNTVLPGVVETPMTRNKISPETEERCKKVLIPMGRFSSAEEIGEVCAFLASDKSSYMTGAAVTVSGGA